MFVVKAKVTKFIDESNPGFVECQFVGVNGLIQIFNDKVPIFTTKMLDKNSNYPVDGIVGCEIIETKNINGKNIVKINTELPWGIESTG
jgi:hypothetical protein